MAPALDSHVQTTSRLDLYSKLDPRYGVPAHVQAELQGSTSSTTMTTDEYDQQGVEAVVRVNRGDAAAAKQLLFDQERGEHSSLNVRQGPLARLGSDLAYVMVMVDAGT